MKQLAIIFVLAIAALSTSAKIVVTGADYTEKVLNKSRSNLFHNTKIDLNNDKIIFDRLPLKNTEYYVLDAHGHAKLSGTLNRKHNMPKLPQGPLTIMLKQGESTMIFGWLANAVVRGRK